MEIEVTIWKIDDAGLRTEKTTVSKEPEKPISICTYVLEPHSPISQTWVESGVELSEDEAYKLGEIIQFLARL